MMHTKPSLLERAAEVFDFASGVPVAPANDLPPPRVRPAPAAPSVEAPAPVVEQPVSEQVASPAPSHVTQPASRPASKAYRPVVRHAEVALDSEALAAAGYLIGEAPSAGLAEEMRLIKRRLLTAIDAQIEGGEEQARVVLVASGRPAEGKTFTALNLALSIAGEPERSVLLVDGDSAKPELMTRLQLDEDRPGFLDSLANAQVDPETLVLDTDVERLSLLPAGRKVRNIPELLASARTEEVLARLREADPRRIIILDSPPALAASSAAVLAGLAGQTLVVVKADQTSETDLKETLDLLSVCDRLSLVLNSTAFQVGSRRFGKYEEYQ
jgi:Mrp family chromosome partitioning ATPase